MGQQTGQHGGARKRAGRKPAPLEKTVPVSVWYCHVRQASDECDCQLDCLIGVKKGERACNTAARSLIFEHIRVRKTNPDRKRVDALGRTFNVVDRVESRWKGTAGILRHPLWKLMDVQLPDLRFVQETIAQQLARLRMRRLDCEASLAYEVNRKESGEPDWHAITLMGCALSGDMNDMALLAAMMVEAALFGSYTTIWKLRRYFDESANAFAGQATLDYAPGLSSSFLTHKGQFVKRLLPETLETPTINHLSNIVEDTKKNRRAEPGLKKQAREMLRAYEDER